MAVTEFFFNGTDFRGLGFFAKIISSKVPLKVLKQVL